jgi:hypothetical protein
MSSASVTSRGRSCRVWYQRHAEPSRCSRGGRDIGFLKETAQRAAPAAELWR